MQETGHSRLVWDWEWETNWSSHHGLQSGIADTTQVFWAAATQKGLVKNRAFPRQTYSHMHMDLRNTNIRLKHKAWDDVFLSLYHVPLLSLSGHCCFSCNAMQKQPTCWASNGDYTDSHLSNLSFAGLFETQNSNLAFNTLGTTKFEVTLRDSYRDS